MTEDEARAWLEAHNVPRETLGRIEQFVTFLLVEGEKQNLISAATRDMIWARHIVDSAQLLSLAQDAGEGAWIDLGSGAGFPGLIIGALSTRPMILIESRRKRVEFLEASIAIMGLGGHVRVDGRRLELVETQSAAIISARAFAPLDRLLPLAERFSHSGTIWILPKGKNARSELEATRKTWQGVFHVEQSVTDADAAIIVARKVKRGKK